MKNKNPKKYIKSILFYLTVLATLCITLFPFLVMLSTSLKLTPEAIGFPPSIIPKHITFEHYRDIFNPKIFPYFTYFKNSLTVALVVAGISTFFGILGGYSISKLDFIGKATINDSFYVVYMFSGILLVVPLFKIISGLGLYDSKIAIIITLVVQTMPTAIFMLKSFFDTIPKELEEAGFIDGLNRLQCIWKIIVPLSISGIISVMVYAFMIAWNDFLFVSVFLSSKENFTLTIGLKTLFGTPDYVWGRMMAASLVTALPIIMMYGLTERFIRGGKVEGGVKG